MIPTANAASDHPESYSQWGEDRLVWEFFGRRSDGFFLEAGAFHPTQLSQTYLLETKGWQGVLVEPMPDQVEAFAEKRPNSRLFRTALGAPEQAGTELNFIVPDGEMSLARLLADGEKPAAHQRSLRVPLTTISEVLSEAKTPRLDYLSLDLEGHELAALRGLDFNRWRPGLIVIEDRVEDLAQHQFLQQQGYQLVYRTGCNNWYVPTGTPFPRCTAWIRLKLFRKMVLARPFRKLRAGVRRLRGR
jgi:FkbM family methyltransferase